MNLAKKQTLISIITFLIFIFIIRALSHVPIPFLYKDLFELLYQEQATGAFKLINVLGGGALSRMSLLTLGVMPYITASIIFFVLGLISPSIKLYGYDEAGKVKVENLKRLLTIFIVLFQSISISSYLISQKIDNQSIVIVSEQVFYLSTFITLLVGTFVLLWIASLISYIGVGNGLTLTILISILATVPENVLSILDLFEQGMLDIVNLSVIIVVVLLLFLVVSIFEEGQRRIPTLVVTPLGHCRTDFFSIKTNPVGLMPAIFASISVAMILNVLTFISEYLPTMISTLLLMISGNSLFRITLTTVLIILFSFALRKNFINPEQIQNQLKTQNKTIKGLRYGKKMDNYLHHLSINMTSIGCIYLSIICIVPELINMYSGTMLYLGGASILIMVTGTTQIRNNIQTVYLSSQLKEKVNKPFGI